MPSSVELACPVCHGDEKCHFCLTFREQRCSRIPDLIPPELRRDPRHAFEIERYKGIMARGLKDYPGYLDTKPEYRARVITELLEEYDASLEFVEIGPGFGYLIRATEGEVRWAVDSCLDFLEPLADLPKVSAVRAVAERLPFKTGSVPCLVSDSTFQTLVNREAFLCEAARVCAPGAVLLLTVGYRANYPRRPQGGFNVLKTEGQEMLFHYLKELGFEMEYSFLNLEREKWIGADMETGDYMYLIGKKR